MKKTVFVLNTSASIAAILAGILASASPAFAAPPGQLVSGYDTGAALVHPLRTDPNGNLYIVGSGTAGSIYGTDTPNTTATQNPVRIGGCSLPLTNTCTVRNVVADANGYLTVNLNGALASITGALPTGGNVIGGVTQSGTWNIGTLTGITNALPTGGNVIGGVTQSGTWNTNDTQSGTWTVQPGNTANTTPWLDSPTPQSGAGVSITPVVSASAESNHVLKASAGNLYRVRVTATVGGYLMLFNATSAPADGAVTPQSCTNVPANQTVEIDHLIPDRFTTGITAVYSSTGCFTKTASATALIEGSVQ